MPKEDCKYWDKCYQKNDAHLQKYNHPKNKNAEKETLPELEKELNAGEAKQPEARKHKTSNDEENPKVDKSPEVKASTSRRAAANGEFNTPGDEQYDVEELRKEALGNISGKNYMLMLNKRIKLSEQSEYNKLLSSNEFIRHKFLVEMPTDFYAFWEFVNDLKKDTTGAQVLQHLEKQFQLKLVGPFEFLARLFDDAKIFEPGDYLRHWRFFYDPPEFQTVFVRSGTGIHYGYWRDTPQDKEGLLIARNDSTKSCEFDFVAGNIFDAFIHYLEKDYPSTPFTAASVTNMIKTVRKYLQSKDLKLEKLETLCKARNAKVVAKTFHRAGIVVPVEAKTNVGYRPLSVSDAELKKILKLFETAGEGESVKTGVMEKLQPIATCASIAMDECDFGTSLELGVDLLCSGRVELHALIHSLIIPAYTLLNRPQFIAIIKAHLEKRSKKLNLSILEKSEI